MNTVRTGERLTDRVLGLERACGRAEYVITVADRLFKVLAAYTQEGVELARIYP